jgi:hypothetical protein
MATMGTQPKGCGYVRRGDERSASKAWIAGW